jgi:hypothetical protein
MLMRLCRWRHGSWGKTKRIVVGKAIREIQKGNKRREEIKVQRYFGWV